MPISLYASLINSLSVYYISIQVSTGCLRALERVSEGVYDVVFKMIFEMVFEGVFEGVSKTVSSKLWWVSEEEGF